VALTRPALAGPHAGDGGDGRWTLGGPAGDEGIRGENKRRVRRARAQMTYTLGGVGDVVVVAHLICSPLPPSRLYCLSARLPTWPTFYGSHFSSPSSSAGGGQRGPDFTARRYQPSKQPGNQSRALAGFSTPARINGREEHVKRDWRDGRHGAEAGRARGRLRPRNVRACQPARHTRTHAHSHNCSRGKKGMALLD